ncbi:hypothetical protein [Nafulsella turpanensis]|uniref:hypothetical protein n=1 Tax=Nafulsella turpanensis TaxID=1265690 RepID=UPI000348DA20|nr:hypothetical protein [Nafulsella turpanensis]
MKKFSIIFLACLSLAACQEKADKALEVDEEPVEVVENPAAEGFNAEASDEKAIALADSVMQAMGGRPAWDNTRYLSWNFFGARELLWDKKTGRVRIEVPNDFTVYLIDMQADTGRIMRYGEEISHPDSVAKYVERGKQIWVNDSYWLFMPFKLKDSGVTLTYAGKDSMQSGAPAEVVELQFEEVGFTPENKYKVYIDPQDKLVKQWAFYRHASADTPNFITPWEDYQRYGDILLSGERGERDITDIAVYEEMPEAAFTDFEFQVEGE